MSFVGKVVLITGASTGIGAATAKEFANLGANLVLCGKPKDDDKLEDVAHECSVNGKKPLMIIAELTNEDDTRDIIERTIRHYGKLDILINNAGILENGTIETTNLEQYDRVMNVNVRAIYHLTMLAVPHLIETKGNIVNVSSVNGVRSFPGVLAYNISKSAIDQFTRCVALELASKQVRVNTVNPGVIVTNIHKDAGMNEEEYAKFLERCKGTHPLGRAGTVSEVAKTITFLASNDATFITGTSILVDGGRHAVCSR